jgi:hypothetical protein
MAPCGLVAARSGGVSRHTWGPLRATRVQQAEAEVQQAVAEEAQLGGEAGSHEDLDAAYNAQMQRQMGWSEPFSYHFDRGLYFHEVGPRLLCGTQPRSPEEVEELALTHGVTTIVNLQQDRDWQHWG